MVYINEKSENSTALFPKNSAFRENFLKLQLVSELTQKKYEFEGLEDSNEYYNYYKVTFNTEGIEDGEYIYTLSGEETESIGLLRVGKVVKPTVKTYDNNTTIKEYKY